jgi:hypothetical protein
LKEEKEEERLFTVGVCVLFGRQFSFRRASLFSLRMMMNSRKMAMVMLAKVL